MAENLPWILMLFFAGFACVQSILHTRDRYRLDQAARILGKPTYNHTREDSPLTPCPGCHVRAIVWRVKVRQ